MKQDSANAIPLLDSVRGVVLDYNISPRGSIEGILLEQEGQTIQINFPKDSFILPLATIGQTIVLDVEPDPKLHKHPAGDHPVYLARSMENGHDPKHGKPVQIEGTVKRLNFARHGEANGVVLDNGDFLHLKPDGMRNVGLTIGQTVVAKGKACPMQLGQRVIAAEVVNGIAVSHKK